MQFFLFLKFGFILFLLQENCWKAVLTCSWNWLLLSTFHQHFTSCFFVWQFNVQLFFSTVCAKITGESDKLAYNISPDRKHCFVFKKKWINRFKMVYFCCGDIVQISWLVYLSFQWSMLCDLSLKFFWEDMGE